MTSGAIRILGIAGCGSKGGIIGLTTGGLVDVDAIASDVDGLRLMGNGATGRFIGIGRGSAPMEASGRIFVDKNPLGLNCNAGFRLILNL